MAVLLLYAALFFSAGESPIIPISNDDSLTPVFYRITGSELKKWNPPGYCLSMSRESACFLLPGQKIRIISFNSPSDTAQQTESTIEKEILETCFYCRQRDLDQTFLFSRKGITIIPSDGSEPRNLAQKIIRGYSYPGPTISGKHQSMVHLPYLISLNSGHILSYQRSTGKWRIYDEAGTTFQSGSTEKKGRPIRLGNHLIWLNLPDKGDCRISKLNQPLKFTRSLNVDKLNRYSLVERGQSGFWVISFPDGFRQALDSWDTGLIPLQLTYFFEENGRVEIRSQKLPDAPLIFSLTVSPGGSPKLKASPGFQLREVDQSSDLFVFRKKNITVFTPVNRQTLYSSGLTQVPLLIRKINTSWQAWESEGTAIRLN
jgi:hypothetical protein